MSDARAASAAPDEHFQELDGLRGWASATVVLSHFSRMYGWPGFDFPYAILTAGPESVLVFFVLSGFVLSLPILRGRQLPYPAFLIRRICRIYLPFLGALIVAVLCDLNFHGPLNQGSWSNLTWTAPVTWKLFLSHLPLILSYQAAQINTAFWSLTHEMRLSLVFPFLCAGVFFLRPTYAWLTPVAIFAGAGSLVSYLVPAFRRQNPDDLTALALTAKYTALFVAGALIARHRAELVAAYKRINSRLFGTLPILVLTLFAGSQSWLGWDRAEPVVAVAATGLLVSAMASKPAKAFLVSRPLRFAGRISYSLYLMHGTVLFALAHMVGTSLRIRTLLVIYLPAAVLVSYLFCVLIEEPSARLGRVLTRRPKRNRIADVEQVTARL